MQTKYKKIIYLLLILLSMVLFTNNAHGQYKKMKKHYYDLYKEKMPTYHKIHVGGSFFGSNTSYSFIFASIDYSKSIKGNTYWGVSYFHGFRCYNTDYSKSDGINEGTGKNIATFSGMLYHYFPLIKNRLYLRGGVGLGAGYHYGYKTGFAHSDVKDQVLPYITVELQAVIRLNNGIEIKLSPLLVSPSRFMYSLKQESIEEGKSTYLFDTGHLSIGFNF